MARGKKLTDKVVSNGIEYTITTSHPIYGLRYVIMTRCYNASARDYPYYQGKGIKLCDEWKNNLGAFFKWCLDNGWQKGLVLDRVDPLKDYEPSNCRFTTVKENLQKMHRDNAMYGEKGSNSKLTEQQVVEIKKLINLEVPLTKIGIKYGLTAGAISAIKRKKNWSHLD